MTVKVYCPGLAFESTLIISFDVAEPPDGGVTGLTVKVVVTPFIFEVLNVTAELNPLTDVTVIIEELEPPDFILSEFGLAEIANVGPGGCIPTVSANALISNGFKRRETAAISASIV